MKTDLLIHILIAIIIGILALIVTILLAAVARRIRNARKYRTLDGYRDSYRRKITTALADGLAASLREELSVRPFGLEWQAIEEILLEQIAGGNTVTQVQRLFRELGYVAHYEGKLKSRRALIRAAAADKLGKMLSASSIAGLVKILNTEENPETLTVTIRALCRIGDSAGLTNLLERLPVLYRKALVSQKTVEAALITLSAGTVPLLVAHGEQSSDTKVKASLLEVLSHLPATARSFDFAAAHMRSPDAEVRSKATRVFGRHKAPADGSHVKLLLPLLHDEVWFVRLQAARALERLRYDEAVGDLGSLLLDQNWQVRNAAARALTTIGDASLDVILSTLRQTDRYAKESICEETEKTHYTDRLIANLGSPDSQVYEKSREILRIMNSLHFSIPLHDYLHNGRDDAIKREVRLIVGEAAVSGETRVRAANGAAAGE